MSFIGKQYNVVTHERVCMKENLEEHIYRVSYELRPVKARFPPISRVRPRLCLRQVI